MSRKSSKSKGKNSLKEDLSLLKAAVDSVKESVLITDRDGAIRYANPAFEKYTGYRLVDVLDKNPSFLKSGSHDAEFYTQMWETILAGKTWEGLITNKTLDGKIITAETTITPVRDAAGEISHFISIKRDVTERVELQRRMELTEKMASAGVLAAGVAHEINNPLTLVIGFSQILSEDERLPQDVRDMLTKVFLNSQRAGNISKTLLDFSRKTEPQRTRVSIAELFERIKPLAGYDLKREGIEYDFVPPPYDCVIHADLNQMEQVLLNLIINAKQAMKRSKEKNLKVFCSRSEGFVAMTVKDTGPGIPKETLGKIFDPFFTTKPIGEGTGLGLAICYGIAHDHGGRIEVNSEVGKGTEFIVYIPEEEAP